MKAPSIKLTISVVLVLLGASLAIMVTSQSDSSGSNEGIIIDFGDWNVTYVEVEEGMDAFSALEYACNRENFELVMKGDQVVSINGLPDGTGDKKWDLFVTAKGEMDWIKITDTSNILISEYSAVAWGLCSQDEVPTPAVDATGINYYNYPQASRVVSLAPSCTETICAVGGFNTLVGTDQYSNYPYEVVEAQEKGDIQITGGFTNPSYETVVKLNPDLVICIDGQASHITTAEKLRKIGINVIVSFGGESLETIMDNTHMIGYGMGYSISTENTVRSMITGLNDIKNILDECFELRYPSVMVSLSTVKSPWVAGSETYISDILSYIYCTNSYGSLSGWVQVNSESIPQYNPSKIIIVSSEYAPTEEDYRKMLDSLPAEWKYTDAYTSGNIYLYSESATDLASRPATRAPQLTELMSRTLHPEAFDDGIEIPKYIGDDYVDYLVYTKELGFN